jgi:DNA-binding transcriptional LysR family regulator
MLDRLRSLAVFAKVAELGSFRAAAQALALSPSVVSHHVRELESHLSLPLLYRSTRRVSLTSDGQRLFDSARAMVQAAERGLDGLSGESATPTGSLKLTAPAFLGETSFCDDLAAFSAAHPRVELTVGFTEEPRDLLRDGLDLAIRMGRLDDSTHRSRKLAAMHRVLVTSPGYVEGRKRPRAPLDLAEWDFVRLRSRPPQVTLSCPGKRAVTVAFRPRLSVDGIAAVRGLVRAGAGLATIPEVYARADLATGRLVQVLPRWRTDSVPVHAIWPGNAQKSALTVRFLDALGPRVSELFGATR